MNYIIVFITALFFTLLLTGVALNVLPALGFMDRAESHHLDKKPVPRGGGVAIFISFTLLALIFARHPNFLSGATSFLLD